MFLFTKSRLFDKSWTKVKIIKHFMIRAFVLLIVGRLGQISHNFSGHSSGFGTKVFSILKIFGGSIWTISFIRYGK